MPQPNQEQQNPEHPKIYDPGKDEMRLVTQYDVDYLVANTQAFKKLNQDIIRDLQESMEYIKNRLIK